MYIFMNIAFTHLFPFKNAFNKKKLMSLVVNFTYIIIIIVFIKYNISLLNMK